jgi:glycerophosphoryl diester phosphodiesterase
MTQRAILKASVVVMLMAISCVYENDAIVPALPNSIILEGDPIPKSSRTFMEGIYKITSGSETFGDHAVLKWHGKDLSLFTERNGCYFPLRAAHLDSVIFLEGYWRYSTNNNTGAVSLRIPKNRGGKYILSKKDGPIVPIIIEGAYGAENNLPSSELVLEYERPFSEKVKAGNFYILAHRSGGRNADNLPVSENTIEMIGFTRNFGTNGVELDIRLTKDNVPIIYHDPDINIRLAAKGPLNGPVSNYTYDQIATYVRLIHGEKIPRLENALNFVIDSTELRAVWLDMKGDVNAMNLVIPLQKKALLRAKLKNRPMEIWIGLPDENVVEQFTAYAEYQNTLSLCELGLEDVRKTNANVWAPRWTEGLQLDKVAQMHAEGRKVFCWTIDDQRFIQQFMEEGKFDGLLSNHSAITSYYYYMQP